MDEQEPTETVHRPSEAASWPKKRTLIIGAVTFDDFIRAQRIVKQFQEDVKKHNQKPGRHHGIGYGGPEVRSIYVWYTANQITIHFGD